MPFKTIAKIVKQRVTNLSKDSEKAPLAQQEEKESQMFKQYGQKQTLVEWVSAGKLQTFQLNQKFMRLGTMIAFFVAVLLALMQDFALLLMFGSIAVFYYILTRKYEGTDIRCELNSYGLVYGDKTYYWDSMKRFFFSRRGEELLVLDLVTDFLPRLLITFPPAKKAEIEKILKEHVMFLEAEPKSTVDRSIESVMSKFNLEDKDFEEKK